MISRPVLVILSVISVDCARILAWFPGPAVSHQRVFQPIWKELSLRGHKITVITPNPLNDRALVNLTEIDTGFTYQVWDQIDISNMRREKITTFEMEYYFQKIYELSIQMSMENQKIQELFRGTEIFDLILIEGFHPILYGLGYKFKAPVVAVTPVSIYSFVYHLLGTPTNPVFYADFLSELVSDLNFREKIENIYFFLGSFLMNKLMIYPNADRIARSYFGPNMPHIENMVKNTSLLLMNVSPIFSDARPLPPNIKLFHNIHLQSNEVLVNDLKEILDKAKEGLIYFSLGTNVRLDHVDKDIKQIILKALGDLPYTVLCKWESESAPGQPKNIILRKWFPQQAILAHPNVKAFVTQGGLQSSEEAISNGVPLIMIPFLGDQPMNAKILTKRGMAETILPIELNSDILTKTILKVAGGKEYHRKAQELRSIFLDQPQTGLDKIVWWCEYVIRHKGAKHLRSPSADISLFEYFMLDVLAVFSVVIFASYKILCIIIRLVRQSFLKNGVNIKEKKNS